MKQLSKNESKYRVKFIQEYHFNKYYQKMLDEEIIKSQLTYKTAYMNFRKNVSNNYKLPQTFDDFKINTECFSKNINIILTSSLSLIKPMNQYVKVVIL